MMQPPASVAHVLAAAAVGMLSGGILRATSQMSGSGTEALLQGLVVLAAVFGAPRIRRPPPARHWTTLPLLLVPALLIWKAEWLHHGLVTGLAPLGALLVRQGWMDAILLGVALLPTARTARVAMGSPGRLGGLWALAGLGATWTMQPHEAMALAAAFLFWADCAPAPHRGWQAPSTLPAWARSSIMALCTTGIVLGWTALRSVVDPTPAGAAVTMCAALAGATLGHRAGPKSATAALAWSLAILSLLLALVGAGTALTDRLGSAAAAWEWGLEGRIWLALPLALTGLIGGLAMGKAARADRPSIWGMGLGLFIGPWALGAGSALTALGILAGILALSTARLRMRVIGASVAVSAIAVTGRRSRR